MKWYQKKWVIISFLVLFFPIGLYLMWKYAKWNNIIKGIITAFFVIAIFSSTNDKEQEIKTVSNNNNIESTKSTEKTKEISTQPTTKPVSTEIEREAPAPPTQATIAQTQPTTKSVSTEIEREAPAPPTQATIAQTQATTSVTFTTKANYEIVKEEDTGNVSMTRKDLRILVSNADELDKTDIENMCKKIISDYTKNKNVNALTLFLYDNEKDVDGGYTLGKCGYYPNGDIGNASNVKSGDYTTFTYSFDIKEKNKSSTPTPTPTDSEIEIYNYLNNLLEEGDGSSEYEDECDRLTAKKFGISEDEVTQIWLKVYLYRH